jgi:hypothetical protein
MDIINNRSILKTYILFIFKAKKKFDIILIFKILKFLTKFLFALNYILRIDYSLFSDLKLIELV